MTINALRRRPVIRRITAVNGPFTAVGWYSPGQSGTDRLRARGFGALIYCDDRWRATQMAASER